MRNKTKHEYKIENIFKAKELFHKKQAKITFEKKLKILTRLQKIANEIGRYNGHKKRMVWKV
ncbi:MAG: hypothetical protein M1517_00225 [Deltaproteobacteria bacterium]|nr:hypothetical protein [Deltaproteobacteria bacterium]